MMDEYRAPAPGISLVAVRDGRVVLSESHGLADLEEGRPATGATHYRLASVTKQFTAAAVLTLASERLLRLTDPASAWLPSLPREAGAVTIEHLLTHTSGLVDYEDVIPPERSGQLCDRDVLRLLEPLQRLHFPPGTAYRYSNSGYALLALIVEQVSGEPFARFLRRKVFDRAGMSTAVAHMEGLTTVPERAWGYSRAGSGWQRTDQNLTSAVVGDGGIYASAVDLVAWMRVLDEGWLAEASVPRVRTDVEGMWYGYGWRIHEHQGRRVVSHTGESIGFRNAVVRVPDERVGVVVLTNRDEGVPLDIALAVLERIAARSS